MANESEDRVLGRIGITLKDEYDATKTYTKLNQVTYNGSSYTLKVKEAKGIEPTNKEYWTYSAQKGDKGDTGNGIESTVLNEDYTLTITFTDGTKYTTSSIKGNKGNTGTIKINRISTGEPGTDCIIENIGTETDAILNITIPRGERGQPGQDGEDGATFTPSVDDEGNLTWTNDKGLDNPEKVNIKGPQGLPGKDGQDGVDGHTPVAGVDYFTKEDKEEFKNAVVQESKEDIDTHTIAKIEEYNNNAQQKIQEFNKNAQKKMEELNGSSGNGNFGNGSSGNYPEGIQEEITELRQIVQELEENTLWNTTEQVTEISVDDAAKYSKNKLTLFGDTYQEVTENSPSSRFASEVHVVTGANMINVNDIQYPLNLGDIEICKIGDSQDGFVTDGNKNWWIDSKIIKFLLDGTENWVIGRNNNGYNIFQIAKNDSSLRDGRQVTSVICNIFTGTTGTLAWQGTGKDIIGIAENNRIRISMLESEYPTVEDFKKLLQENNATCYAVRGGAVLIPITDETLITQLDEIYSHLKLVKGTNHIRVIAEDLAPEMQLTYMQDLPSKINNMESRLALLE